MSTRRAVVALRLFLAAALIVCVFSQVLVLPVASGWAAQALPEVSYMRWPVLAWSIMMVLFGEIVLVCTWRLLDAVAQGRIFTRASLPWVNRITGCFMAAGAALLVGLFYLVVDGTVGPVTVHFFVLMAAVGCFALASLMTVLRALLVQATQLHSDMEQVI